MFSKFRFTSKDLCPCNSGKIYFECCAKKKDREFRNDKQKSSIISVCARNSRIKICLFADCNAKPRNIIKAHALQENKILSQLAVEQQVLMKNLNTDPVKLEIEKGIPEPFYFLEEMHIKDATVAICFCGKHDNAIFSKIEKGIGAFESIDEEQLFLFAYRTFSFEYYKSLTRSIYYGKLIKEVPQLFRDPSIIYEYKEHRRKYEGLIRYKQAFDRIFKDKKYDSLETIVIKLPEQIKFAAYMCIAPTYDLKGKRIKTIDRKTNETKYAFITIFPNFDSSYILISCFKDDLKIYGKYVNQFRELPIGIVKYYINAFIPLYTNNLIISPLLWERFDEQGKMGLQYTVSERSSTKSVLRKGVQFGMKNISKLKVNEQEKISTDYIKFNFFQ